MHRYAAHLIWMGNQGRGTSTYAEYGRHYRVEIAGKPALMGTADPRYGGEPDQYNPEDWFLAAVSACHMLSYLALCARQSVCVLEYEDRAVGTLIASSDGGGAFEAVLLTPVVTIAADSNHDLALTLHDRAHELCFIANSCRTPIRVAATIRTRYPQEAA